MKKKPNHQLHLKVLNSQNQILEASQAKHSQLVHFLCDRGSELLPGSGSSNPTRRPVFPLKIRIELNNDLIGFPPFLWAGTPLFQS